MRTFLFLVAVACLQSITHAGFEFRISLDTPFASNLAGTTVARDVFLVATNPDVMVSANTAEFNLNAAVGAGNTKVTDFTFDPNFQGSIFQMSSKTITATGVDVRLYSAGSPAINNQVRLGSVTLMLGDNGNATNLVFTDPGVTPASPTGLNVNVLAPGQTNIDGQVFPRTLTANVAAVPEPSSLLLVSSLAFGFAFRRRRC